MYKQNNFLKWSKGITLIALVITIIVLLILAGVSIAMLTRSKWLTNTSRKCKRRNRKVRGKRENSSSGIAEAMEQMERLI